MKAEWLVKRLDSLNARDIRLREMAKLDLSDENKRKLLERSEQLQHWDAEKWQPFIAALEDGDEVWSFRSPPPTWNQFCGCAGYAVLRDGEIIRTLVTMRS